MYNSLSSQLLRTDNNNNFTNLENLNINQNTEENNKILENIKNNTNYISTIPNSDQYNMRYITNSYIYSTQNINNTDSNLANDLNYGNNKRNKSAYIKKKSKKVFYGVGSPIAQRWKNDNTVAKKIINNLEIKIDALNYENSLLKQNLGDISKYDKYNLYEKNLSLENRHQIDNKFSTINQFNEKMDMQNLNYTGNEGAGGNEGIGGFGGVEGMGGSDDALYKEIEQLRNEVTKLKESNQYLKANNTDLSNTIKNLRNSMNPTQNYINEDIVIKEEIEESKNIKKINLNDNLDNKNNLNDNNKNKNKNNNNINENNNNNNIKIIEEGINEKRKNININLNTDGSKYRINEDKFLQLLDINENLHKKLRNLLSICEEEVIKYKPTSFENISKNVNTIQKDYNSKNIYLNTIGNNIKELKAVNIERSVENNLSLEDLLKENALLKRKLKELNDAINEINSEQTIKLAKFQEILNESRTVQTLDDSNNIMGDNNYKNEELDIILNSILLKVINPKDEEAKKILNSLQNINNSHKKRVAQCKIIDEKLKLILKENNLLNNRMFKMKNENNTLNNINSNINRYKLFSENRNNLSSDYLFNDLNINRDNLIPNYNDNNLSNELKYNSLAFENNKLSNNLQKGKNNKNREKMVGKIVFNKKGISTGQKQKLDDNMKDIYNKL